MQILKRGKTKVYIKSNRVAILKTGPEKKTQCHAIYDASCTLAPNISIQWLEVCDPKIHQLLLYQ